MCYTCVNASCAFLVQGERHQLAADVQAPPLGHFRRKCRALRLDDVRHVADVRVGCGRVVFSHHCPRGPLPGDEVPASAECAEEDGLLLEAEVFLRIDHKL